MVKSQENFPTVLVVLGATGDLMQRKLIPAFFELHRKQLLPYRFQVVGVARRSLSKGQFQETVKQALDHKSKTNGEVVDVFARFFSYSQGVFEETQTYERLAQALAKIDEAWQTCANKIFYLATPPEHYEVILRHLAKSGLTIPCGPGEGWTRVVVEKPFGRDLKTAEALDALLGQLFREEQIYRLDHYLGKETVQNILAFRFSNLFLEPAWNNQFIQSIRIQFLERAPVGGRGEFYDRLGALRDVGQNHLLQLLALFTMEPPPNFEPEAIRRARSELLGALPRLNLKEVSRQTIRGQYQGYEQEPGVAPNSQTETYFALKMFLNTSRWTGVAIYLEAGKSLAQDKVEVSLIFKHREPCLCPSNGKNQHYRNVLRYQIQPQESINLSFAVKRPGLNLILEERDFIFDYRGAYQREEFLEAYERLCLDILNGNQVLFVSTSEIMASWRFIDPIIESWQAGEPLLRCYRPGSPEMSRELDEKNV